MKKIPIYSNDSYQTGRRVHIQSKAGEDDIINCRIKAFKTYVAYLTDKFFWVVWHALWNRIGMLLSVVATYKQN